MNNRTFIRGIIAVILILMGNVGLFLFSATFTMTFWICYAFMMLAALITAYVEIFYINKKPFPIVYEVTGVTVFYLIVELIAGTVCKTALWFLPARAFFIQFSIFCLFLVAFLFVVLHGSHIGEQQAVRSKQLINFKYILESMKSAVADMDYANPQRKTVMHAYDSLASGQVTSREDVVDLEENILNSIESLKEAINENNQGKIEELCKQIEKLSDERKRKLSIKAPF